MSDTAHHARSSRTDPTLARPGGDTLLRVLVWLALAAIVLRFAVMWANALAGTTIPVPGSIGFTLLFTTFSLLHAASVLGWRRAAAFLLVCAAVSWCFEAVGLATGLVYGAYHYGARLGPKLGAVPVIIPLAWFMMVYASWVVARLLLHGASDPRSGPETAARIVVAAMVMTAWDTVMDPGMARSGAWVWEHGGSYFGVPVRNFAGWLATTATVYALAELVMQRLRGRPCTDLTTVYAGLPAVPYALLALDSALRPSLPELRVVAVFGMGFAALLALLRLALIGRAVPRGRQPS